MLLTKIHDFDSGSEVAWIFLVRVDLVISSEYFQIFAPDENGNVQLKLEIEESSDLEVWLNEGKKLEGEFQLAEGKKFLRFALPTRN